MGHRNITGIHHSKYWMSIHYDTIEDGQNKKSHLLFSNFADKDKVEKVMVLNLEKSSAYTAKKKKKKKKSKLSKKGIAL